MWHYCRDEPDDNISDSNSFKLKSRFWNNTDNTSTVHVEMAVSLKHLSNFWRILEMLLINCEMTFILTSSVNCAICKANWAATFAKTDTELYVPIVILSTYDKTKLITITIEIKCIFNRSIYQSKVSTYAKNNI